MWLKRIIGVLLPGIAAGCAPTGWSVQQKAKLEDLESLFAAVVEVEHAVVVIQVVGAEEFIQFNGGTEEVVMDFPLFSAEQKSREDAIRHFAGVRDLELSENLGSDGGRFLDVVLPSNPDDLAQHTRDAFAELMQIASDVELEVLGDGFEWEGPGGSS